jgi:hypothetical protein
VHLAPGVTTEKLHTSEDQVSEEAWAPVRKAGSLKISSHDSDTMKLAHLLHGGIVEKPKEIACISRYQKRRVMITRKIQHDLHNDLVVL